MNIFHRRDLIDQRKNCKVPCLLSVLIDNAQLYDYLHVDQRKLYMGWRAAAPSVWLGNPRPLVHLPHDAIEGKSGGNSLVAGWRDDRLVNPFIPSLGIIEQLVKLWAQIHHHRISQGSLAFG